MVETMTTTLNPCFTSLPQEFMELIGKERRRRRQLKSQSDKSVQQLQWIAPMVICTQCFTELPRECFSANQLNRGKNRCLACVGVVPPSAVEALPELAEASVSCSQCYSVLPRVFFPAAPLAAGQVCMPCIGAATNAASMMASVNWPDSATCDGTSHDCDGSEAASPGCGEADSGLHHTFDLPKEPAEVLVVNSRTSGAYAALRHDALNANLVAIDAEWRPDLPDVPGSNNPIAVLQLAFSHIFAGVRYTGGAAQRLHPWRGTRPIAECCGPENRLRCGHQRYGQVLPESHHGVTCVSRGYARMLCSLTWPPRQSHAWPEESCRGVAWFLWHG